MAFPLKGDAHCNETSATGLDAGVLHIYLFICMIMHIDSWTPFGIIHRQNPPAPVHSWHPG
ncbi:MAG: hypothetical protein V3T56_01010, partial [Gemmatimonadales bacterium]